VHSSTAAGYVQYFVFGEAAYSSNIVHSTYSHDTGVLEFYSQLLGKWPKINTEVA